MAAPEFASFRSSHFEFLAPLTRRAAFPPGAVLCRRGEPLPGSWLVLSGRVRVGAGGPDLVAGSVAAGEALVGARTAETTLEAAGALQALFLPGDALRHCAETFPELGLALLAQKLAA
jgi:CRP-like cAMP-binding protein